MASIRIACLVARTNKAGIVSWYWQPSKTLAAAGFKPVALGKDETRAIMAARIRNAEVDRWKNGDAPPVSIQRRAQQGTLGALITRYRRDIVRGTRPDGRPWLAPSTARLYDTGLKRLEKWAGKQPLAFVTPARVRALRDAMLAPPEKGGLGHHAAHQTLKMGRSLFKFAIDCDIIAQGTNPFTDFGLAQPAPRATIWSAPAREVMIAAAHAANMPSIALAIMLGFATAQREQDLLALTISKYVALPEHSIQPEDYRALAAEAPDGIPRGIRIRQLKTNAWVDVPIMGEVRRGLETNIAAARANGQLLVLLDDTRTDATGRLALYSGAAGQTRFQRDFAAIRAAAAAAAITDGNTALAAEIDLIQFRDLRRTCVVYLGELGLDAHLITAITGHDIDETQRILKTYMPRTTGRAAHAMVLSTAREAKEAQRKENAG